MHAASPSSGGGRGARVRRPKLVPLKKTPSGIRGLDEITFGGLPVGRPTLVCGDAGAGKTLFAAEFLVRGARDHDETGVFVSFEETEQELAQNVASLGFDLKELIARRRLAFDYVHIERAEIEEAGDYDLEGLFIRIGAAIDRVKAKRVVLDTLESLFGGLSNHAVLRSEIRRLFRMLKDRGVTAVVTAERGDGRMTRQGLEEYVSDCVILLDHRVLRQVSTRRLRVVKYRGSLHETNEYPFTIDAQGIRLSPVTSLHLDYPVDDRRVSSGVPTLDAMLGGRGFHRGDAILLSGTAGTGKSTLAAAFAEAACRRGERALYWAFEEPSAQLVRNMATVGVTLAPWIKKGLLRIDAVRATTFGLETHLAMLMNAAREFEPQVVVCDPVTTFIQAGEMSQVDALLTRFVDYLKARGTTAVYTTLTGGGEALESTAADCSSFMDAWILVRNLDEGHERRRALRVLKARGIDHQLRLRELVIGAGGPRLRDLPRAGAEPRDDDGEAPLGSRRDGRRGLDGKASRSRAREREAEEVR
jgi:circadian clock protein KaiC